jgi:hypothetical protein
LFVQWVYRFGHTPETVVSDRGPQFVSSFWKEVCRIIGVRVKLSTAFHKETDCQTEIINKYIDQRLRPFVNYYQDNWSELLPMMDRAQNTLPHSAIGMSPYELQYGISARNSWDWNTPKPTTPIEKLNYKDARIVADRMKKAIEIAKSHMERAQERMVTARNRHRRPADLEVGQKVYLSTKNLKVERPSRKLSKLFKGSFTILEKLGNAYRLDLPKGSRVHDVFAPELLLRDPENPLPGQENPKPDGELIDGKEEWEVHEILAVRLVRKTLEYRANWVGHDPDDTWYPADNFMYSPHKLRDFHAQYPDKPGPPRKLPQWITAWEEGRDLYDELKDNRPIEK